MVKNVYNTLETRNLELIWTQRRFQYFTKYGKATLSSHG